jgi:hypothetical protein
MEHITDSETDIHSVLSRELSAAHLAWLFVHVLGTSSTAAGHGRRSAEAG